MESQPTPEPGKEAILKNQFGRIVRIILIEKQLFNNWIVQIIETGRKIQVSESDFIINE